MKYMILAKATRDSEAGALIDASGLQASSKGWRIFRRPRKLNAKKN
jgi:hypothetical protein